MHSQELAHIFNNKACSAPLFWISAQCRRNLVEVILSLNSFKPRMKKKVKSRDVTTIWFAYFMLSPIQNVRHYQPGVLVLDFCSDGSSSDAIQKQKYSDCPVPSGKRNKKKQKKTVHSLCRRVPRNVTMHVASPALMIYTGSFHRFCIVGVL